MLFVFGEFRKVNFYFHIEISVKIIRLSVMSKEKSITWSEAVEKAIIESGYLATLKQIHRLAPTFKEFEGLTPDKTINERVQRDSRFYKIKPGLYALKAHLDKIPDEYNPHIEKSETQEQEITHSYIQGLLIEIGNSKGYQTYTPDKGRKFLNRTLSDVATENEIPQFTFKKIIHSTKYIDVIWFNERQFPTNIFEVENSTNIRNSLVKFAELQDFATSMTIVAPHGKLKQFAQEIQKAAFSSIERRVKFYDYEFVEKLYNHEKESAKFKGF